MKSLKKLYSIQSKKESVSKKFMKKSVKKPSSIQSKKESVSKKFMKKPSSARFEPSRKSRAAELNKGVLKRPAKAASKSPYRKEVLYMSAGLKLSGDVRFIVGLGLKSLPELRDKAWIRKYYRTVYEVPIAKSNREDLAICEKLFSKLNHITSKQLLRLPGCRTSFLEEDVSGDLADLDTSENAVARRSQFICHTSMSVGDIVCLHTPQAATYYLCDGLGFEKL